MEITSVARLLSGFSNSSKEGSFPNTPECGQSEDEDGEEQATEEYAPDPSGVLAGSLLLFLLFLSLPLIRLFNLHTHVGDAV